MISPKTSLDLFNKIRSKFGNITIGDDKGSATADPSKAVFFDFEFTEDEDKFGRISISLADGDSMKVFYNRDMVAKIDEDDKNEWYDFVKELKDFAVEHQLEFDIRDITKTNLDKQDYKNLADTGQTVNTDEMSEELQRITKLAGVEVKEGLTGTRKSSYENLDKTRLIIRHAGPVDETVPGARSRHINSLYIENEDGERFKYPVIHLAGARAMTRHVANGGRPHDDFGQHIIQTSEDIAKLSSFSRYASNKDQLNDNAGDIIEQTKLSLENLRMYIKNIGKQSHYETAVKDYKKADALEMDDETANSYREKFTLKNFDDRVEQALPIIHRVMSEFKDKEPTQTPVDLGAVVQGYLADPKNKLVLRKDDAADNMLKVTKFTNKNTMLSSILSDIASRMLTKSGDEDQVANFASRVADELDGEGQPFFKPTKDYMKNKKIAIQLAKRYIDDYKKMQADPKYADEIRMEPGPKKDRQGKAKEEGEQFETWAENVEAMGEGAKIKPYVSMYSDPDDGKTIYDVLNADGESAMKTGDYDAATRFLKQNYDKLKMGTPEKQEILSKNYTGSAMLGQHPKEGNEFAMAVQKAKAAGMKAGDKFKVGDKEYTLKDAIELAGLKLEEFFQEEETVKEQVNEDKKEDSGFNIAGVDEEVDRIVNLANYS
jgi:arsenate reductase-like glutaredoxin family protein